MDDLSRLRGIPPPLTRLTLQDALFFEPLKYAPHPPDFIHVAAQDGRTEQVFQLTAERWGIEGNDWRGWQAEDEQIDQYANYVNN